MIRPSLSFVSETRAPDGRLMRNLPRGELRMYRAWALAHANGRYQTEAMPFRITWRTRDFCFAFLSDIVIVEMTEAGWPFLMEFARDLRVFFSGARRLEPCWNDARFQSIRLPRDGQRHSKPARTRAEAVQAVRFKDKIATL